jgi:hypothetical protein
MGFSEQKDENVRLALKPCESLLSEVALVRLRRYFLRSQWFRAVFLMTTRGFSEPLTSMEYS